MGERRDTETALGMTHGSGSGLDEDVLPPAPRAMFLAGDVLADRYAVVRLLGRGGWARSTRPKIGSSASAWR